MIRVLKVKIFITPLLFSTINSNKQGISFDNLIELMTLHNILLYDHAGFCYNLDKHPVMLQKEARNQDEIKYLCIAFHNGKIQKINMQIANTIFSCSDFPDQYMELVAKNNGKTTLPKKYWDYYMKATGSEMIHENVNFIWKIKHDLNSYRSVIIDLDLQTTGTKNNEKYLSSFELSWINSRSKKISVCHPRITSGHDESIEFAIVNFRIQHYFQNMENILRGILSHHFNNYLEVSKFGFRTTVTGLKLNNFFELMTALTALHTNQMFEVSASSDIYADTLSSFAKTYKFNNRNNFLKSELEQHNVVHCEHLIDMRTLSRYHVFETWYKMQNPAFYNRYLNLNKIKVFEEYCKKQFNFLREKYSLKISDEVLDKVKMKYPKTTDKFIFQFLVLTTHSNLNTYLNLQDDHWHDFYG